MKCLYCQAELKSGSTTYTINRHGYHLVIDNLAAYKCPQCGEVLLDESAVQTIQQITADIDSRIQSLQNIAV